MSPKNTFFKWRALTKKIGQREVLKDIWLAFYPGAKIGVLGRNGSGKSTLLRIMAGMDKNFDGEAKLTEGFTVGLLEQEPQLNPDKDVFGNVEEAVAAHAGAAHRVRAAFRKARRSDRPRRDGKAARAPGQGAGQDRACERLGARPAGRDRDGAR